MPPPASQVDWEMALVMPLGALANKLVKIEGDLRFLSMKATEHSRDAEARPTKAIDTRLDLIYEALDSIRGLLVKLQADIHPKEPPAKVTTGVPAEPARHKPLPDQDD